MGNLIARIAKRKGLQFFLLLLLGSLAVFAYIYFFGFEPRGERESLLVPKAMVFVVLLLTFIWRVRRDQGKQN